MTFDNVNHDVLRGKEGLQYPDYDSFHHERSVTTVTSGAIQRARRFSVLGYDITQQFPKLLRKEEIKYPSHFSTNIPTPPWAVASHISCLELLIIIMCGRLFQHILLYRYHIQAMCTAVYIVYHHIIYIAYAYVTYMYCNI